MIQGRKIALMLAPALILLGVLFFGGLAIALARAGGLATYGAVLQDSDFRGALGLSLYIAVTSTALSMLGALMAALLLRRAFRGRKLAMFFFQLNLTVPHLVGALGILYLFSQSGVFARLAWAAGLITQPADFPAMIYDPQAIGIILQYVWKEVPFLGMIVLANMQALGEDYEQVARAHGASRVQAFFHVLLPMLMPGLARAGIIVFVFAFGAYEIPLILGQNHPAALPVLAYHRYMDLDLALRPQALAMGMVIAVITAAMVALYLRWR